MLTHIAVKGIMGNIFFDKRACCMGPHLKIHTQLVEESGKNP